MLNSAFPWFQWPFVRLWGVQEPASTLFSILNGVSNVIMLRKFRRKVPSSAPLYYLWHSYAFVRRMHFTSFPNCLLERSITAEVDVFRCASTLGLGRQYSILEILPSPRLPSTIHTFVLTCHFHCHNLCNSFSTWIISGLLVSFCTHFSRFSSGKIYYKYLEPTCTEVHVCCPTLNILDICMWVCLSIY